MSSSVFSRVSLGFVASLIVAACLASTAYATVIADWQFNGDNFLADSSGNGHTLSSAGAVSQVDNAASFNGGVLSANIDLTPYRKVTISWEQNGNTSGDHIVYEHSSDYNSHTGAVLGLVGSANLSCGAGVYNIDAYSVGSGAQSFSVQYNLDAANVGDIVKVFQGTGEIGTADLGAGHQSAAPASFINAVFSIGGRQTGAFSFIGTIDNFKIEGTMVPEPGTILMASTCLPGLLAYAWRKRKM